MNIDGKQLDEIYALYGFRKRNSSEKGVNVYTFRAGYFNNADIVPLVVGADPERDFAQFQKSGFACAIRQYKSVEDAERLLFEGFFSLQVTRDKFYSDVERFVTRQGELIGVNYRYISPPYRELFGEASGNHSPLIGHLVNDLSNAGPRLIILEAAAGYGKTCTSYELLRTLLDSFPKKVPFFIELSRNRQAKLFRYVLLDEKDRLFPSLSAELVESQISRGRLLLIVDGFDELLHRTESISIDYDEVEPMLETISDLLCGEAKIILTTRRTAIFSGDNFHQWMEKHSEQFTISRYSIQQPRLEDWLSFERRHALESKDFPLRQLSNPVLLAFLSGQSEEGFEKLASNPDVVVDQYFSRLLEREKERQNLSMSTEEQYLVFTKLAEQMVDEDFTAEDHSYLQQKIAEKNARLLAQVRNRYPAETRPTLDELATKLVSHALMDRKSEESDRVGFVNDFVLGTFVGEAATASETDEWIAGEGFVEQSISAFVPRNREKREKLWAKLQFAIEFLEPERQIGADISLKGELNRDLNGKTIVGIALEETTVGRAGKIEWSVFVDCSFTKVTFVFDGIQNVTFVGCRFFGCEFVPRTGGDIPSIFLTACSGDISQLKEWIHEQPEEDIAQDASELGIYKKRVLEQFWPVGRPHMWPRKQIHTLYRGHGNEERGSLNVAIDALQRDGILELRADSAEINLDKVREIRAILGRAE